MAGLITNQGEKFALHVSHYGHELLPFLLHSMKSNNYALISISDDSLSFNTASQVKLFSNIISGEISSKDCVLVCNKNVYNYISEEEIIKTVVNNSPENATNQFKTMLSSLRSKNFMGLIITFLQIQPLTKQELKKNPFANSTIETYTEELTIETQPDNLDDDFMPNNKISSEESINQLISTETDTKRILASRLKSSYITNIIEKSKTVISSGVNKLKNNKFIPNKNNNKQINNSLSRNKVDYNKIKNNTLTFLKKFTNICQKYIKLLVKYIAIFAKKTVQFLKAVFKKFNKLPGKTKLIIFIFILLLCASFYSVKFIKTRKEEEVVQNNNETLRTKINKDLEQITSAILIQNNAKAINLIKSVEKDIDTLAKTDQENKSLIDNYRKKLTENKNSLQKISSVQIAKIKDLTPINQAGKLDGLIIKDDKLYTFDNQDKRLYIIDLKTKETSIKNISSSKIGVLNNIKLSLNDDIILSDNNNNLIKYSLEEDEFTIISVNIDEFSDYTFFNKYLYILANSEKQIYKYTESGNSFINKIPWISNSNNINFSQIKNISIDGDIYVANKNRIYRLNIGELADQQINLNKISPRVDSIEQMFTDEESDFIYLLDKNTNRIIVINKQGQLITQYKNSTINNLEAFWVDEKNELMYIVDKKIIYRFKLSHIK